MAGSNFAYAATRARVRRSKLLKAEAYRHMMAMQVVEITRYIQELDYREDIDRYASLYKGLDLIEVALASNLRRNSSIILSFCKGQLEELVSHYLERYRIRDLKRVIRGLYAGQDAESIVRGMLSSSVSDRKFFTRLAQAINLTEMAELLAGTPYQSVLGGFLDDELGTLQPIEDALDCYYYRQLLETVRPTSRANRLLLEFIRKEIDVVNLKTITRLRHRGVTGFGELLVEGGSELPIDGLAATTSLEDVASVVEGTHIGKAVADDLVKIEEEEGLHHLILTLDQYLAEGAGRFSRLYPLSVLPILDYLLQKEYEVANLRAIARGKELNIPNSEIEELLVVI